MNIARPLASVAVIAAIADDATATTYLVPTEFPTVQAAIAAAAPGDTILVAPGTYAETIDFLGKGITVRATGGPGVTVLQGNGYAAPPSVVTFASGEGPSAVLEGFTITGGWSLRGGGILCDQSSPTLLGNVVTANFAGDFNQSGYGAGVYVREGAPHLEGNVIEANVASSHYGGTYGGGLYSDSGAPIVIDNVFRANRASNGGGVWLRGAGELRSNVIEQNFGSFGGGLALIAASARVVDNRIRDNRLTAGTSFGRGGGVYVQGGAPLIDGNAIDGNRTYDHGAGVYCTAGAAARLVNDTIVDNSGDFFAPTRGGGLYVGYDCAVLVTNSILWGNAAAQGAAAYVALDPHPSSLELRFSDLEGGAAGVAVDAGSTLVWGPGMIAADPLLEDVHLTYRSPCMNAGQDADVVAAVDFDGDPRVSFGRVDIGADEVHLRLYHVGDATPGGGVRAKIVGVPGMPVALFIGAGLLATPISTVAGPFYLASPLAVVGPLGPLPMSGFTIVEGRLPAVLPTPLDIPLQALVGAAFTNVDVVEVR